MQTVQLRHGKCRPGHAGQGYGLKDHAIVGPELTGAPGRPRQGAVLLGIGAGSAIPMAARYGIAYLAEGAIQDRRSFSCEGLAAMLCEMEIDLGSKLDFSDIGKAVRCRAGSSRRGDAGQHGLEKRCLEGPRIIFVGENSVSQTFGRQSSGQAGWPTAERGAVFEFPIVEIQPRLDACIGPVGRGENVGDAIGAFKGTHLHSGDGTTITGLNAHGRFRN
ncbi:hypothetical protein [Caulobacter sp. HMWF009]|uniref:hypothetical protein n=1 Tax=Caulobacter sp. HMWF009 TaxID=2056846 RepID=UPI0035119825